MSNANNSYQAQDDAYNGDWSAEQLRFTEILTQPTQEPTCYPNQYPVGSSSRLEPGSVLKNLFGGEFMQDFYSNMQYNMGFQYGHAYNNIAANEVGGSSGYDNMYNEDDGNGVRGIDRTEVENEGGQEIDDVEDNYGELNVEEDNNENGEDSMDELDEWEMLNLGDVMQAFVKFINWYSRRGYRPAIGRGGGKELHMPADSQWRNFESLEGEYTYPPKNRDRWVLPCRPKFDLPPRHTDEYLDPNVDKPLAIGSSFLSKSRMQEKMVAYLMAENVGFKVWKSDKQRYWVKCGEVNCNFQLRATGADSIWRVYRLLEHSCQFNPARGTPRTLPSKFLGKLMAEQIVVEGDIMAPKAVREHLKNKSVDVTYGLARMIRSHAISTLYGDDNSSFSLLPSYFHVLEQENPNTVTDYIVDPITGQFRFAFVALAASIAGFTRARPFIVIDGTHLKSKYRGVLFVAVTKDGNNQIYPLAFGIGGVESKETWTWFLTRFRHAFDCPDRLLIVSDASPAIGAAVATVFPTAHHALCCQHIRQNLARYGKRVVGLFTAAAFSYKIAEYNMHMESLARICPAAHDHLINVVGEARFARVHCPVRRYDIMTSNVVESMNSRLLWARRLPVCSLLEAIRTIVEEWFVGRSEHARKWTGELTEHAQEKLLSAVQEGMTMKVQRKSANEFTVIHEQKAYAVDLNRRACSCQRYQHDLIPCGHAAASIRYVKQDPTAYVDDRFKLQQLRYMWSGAVEPVPHPSDWSVPQLIRDAVCLSPDNPRQAGRPRKSRIPSGPERHKGTMRSQTCGRCGGTGHNARRCAVEISVGVEDTEQPTSSKPQRARKKCSRCKVAGHTAPKCPMHRVDLNTPAPDG